MKENRFSYLIMALTVIIIGIISRTIDFIPLYIGDLLYAVMVYFGIHFLFIRWKKIKSVIIALLICYSIELLQLYNAEWMIALRTTFFGRYVLGQGFLWTDIVSYSFGIILSYYIEVVVFNKKYQI